MRGDGGGGGGVEGDEGEVVGGGEGGGGGGVRVKRKTGALFKKGCVCEIATSVSIHGLDRNVYVYTWILGMRKSFSLYGLDSLCQSVFTYLSFHIAQQQRVFFPTYRSYIFISFSFPISMKPHYLISHLYLFIPIPMPQDTHTYSRLKNVERLNNKEPPTMQPESLKNAPSVRSLLSNV